MKKIIIIGLCIISLIIISGCDIGEKKFVRSEKFNEITYEYTCEQIREFIDLNLYVPEKKYNLILYYDDGSSELVENITPKYSIGRLKDMYLERCLEIE